MTKDKPTLDPIAAPPAPRPLSADHVAVGPPIPAIERIRLLSSVQWEEFVLEWVDSLRQQYADVARYGGAGDMGRDVVAFVGGTPDWDNYQCKHYDHPLYPSDALPEIGKLLYYVHRGDFAYPRRYFFVAPQGVGTTLSNLIRSPELLRQELVDTWEKRCLKEITSTASVPLEGAFLAFVNTADFRIFDAVQPLRLIEQHSRTRWHVARFGGGLPSRPLALAPPDDVQLSEINYVGQLLRAYADHLRTAVPSVDALRAFTVFFEHFSRSREDFYSAESLRNFSRDTLPPGEFERLQDEFFRGVIDVCSATHPDGYERVVKTVTAARALQITAHALVSRLYTQDRSGICHQLANADRLRWIP